MEYNTPFKYRAFIVSNEDAIIAKFIHDMHCKIINKHLRLNKSIHIFSEILRDRNHPHKNKNVSQ